MPSKNVLDFLRFSSFRSQSVSKRTGVKNRGQISEFPPVEIRGGMGEMFEWIEQVQTRTQPLMYFRRGASARIGRSVKLVFKSTAVNHNTSHLSSGGLKVH